MIANTELTKPQKLITLNKLTVAIFANTEYKLNVLKQNICNGAA